MREMNRTFRRPRDAGNGAIALESERRLQLPCVDLVDGMYQMVAAGQLSNYGFGWRMLDMGLWIRVDYSRELLGLPRG